MTGPEVDILNIYKGAVANELRHDAFIHQKLSLENTVNIIIPRYEKIQHLFGGNNFCIKLFAVLVNRLWNPLIFPVLLSLQFLMATLGLIRHKKALEIKGSILCANSIQAFSLAERAQFSGTVIALNDNVLKHAEIKQLPAINFMHQVRYKDISQAVCLAWKTKNLIEDNFNQPGARLQNYAAFKWFLAWFVLSRIMQAATELWFINDSDRWAVMFDQLPLNAKRILLQHGLLIDPISTRPSRPVSPLAEQLRNIDLVVAFDEEQKRLFTSMILSPSSSTEFKILTAKLTMTEWPKLSSKGFRLLVLCEPGKDIRECALVKEIIKRNHLVEVIIKPHPSYSTKPYQGLIADRVHMLTDSTLYPKGDLAVLFGTSTVGKQYEWSGVPVIWCAEETLEETLSTIESAIEEKCS